MIRLEQEAVAVRQMAEDRPIDRAEVAGHADPRAVAGFDDEAGRIGRVVHGAPRMDVEVANPERGVVLENDCRRLGPVDPAGLKRATRQVDGDAELAGDRFGAPDMVVVFMRDDDGLE